MRVSECLIQIQDLLTQYHCSHTKIRFSFLSYRGHCGILGVVVVVLCRHKKTQVSAGIITTTSNPTLKNLEPKYNIEEELIFTFQPIAALDEYLHLHRPFIPLMSPEVILALLLSDPGESGVCSRDKEGKCNLPVPPSHDASRWILFPGMNLIVIHIQNSAFC